MIRSFLMIAIMAHQPQTTRKSTRPIVLEVGHQTIKLDFSKVKIEKIEDVSDCVYLAWRKGRISHREAIQALARLACVDDARVKGRPLSFHGDSWVSTGHWSKVLKDVIYIHNKGTKDRSYPGAIRLMLVEEGLARQVSDKFGEKIEFEKKPLSSKQKSLLIRCVQNLEAQIAQDARFDGKELIEEPHSSDDCEDSVAIKALQ